MTTLKLELKEPVCINGLTEDDLRALVDAIEVSASLDEFENYITSSNGTQVKFSFAGDGNFLGVTAKLNSKTVKLINGVNSNQLYLFKGSPTNTNPGVGFKVESDLTRQYLNQPPNESVWEIFFASREQILNTI